MERERDVALVCASAPLVVRLTQKSDTSKPSHDSALEHTDSAFGNEKRSENEHSRAGVPLQ